MISIAILDPECAPTRAFSTDAGLDLKAGITATILPDQVVKVPCRIKVEIPMGYFGLITPRSGLGTKKGIILANTVGVIDAGYRGEVICFMRNTGSAPHTIQKGDAIAQLIVMQCVIGNYWEVDESELSDSPRGEGGFGHTG
jgi:dUTP pyrophosphatase